MGSVRRQSMNLWSWGQSDPNRGRVVRLFFLSFFLSFFSFFEGRRSSLGPLDSTFCLATLGRGGGSSVTGAI